MAHIHLPDGVMPLEWCAVWFIVAGVLIGVAMLAARREAEFRQRILVAFLTVILFVVMMIPVPSPFGGTHVNLTSLAGIVAGPVGSAVVVFIFTVFLAATAPANVSVAFIEAFITSVVVQSVARSRTDIVVAERTMRRV